MCVKQNCLWKLSTEQPCASRSFQVGFFVFRFLLYCLSFKFSSMESVFLSLVSYSFACCQNILLSCFKYFSSVAKSVSFKFAYAFCHCASFPLMCFNPVVQLLFSVQLGFFSVSLMKVTVATINDSTAFYDSVFFVEFIYQGKEIQIETSTRQHGQSIRHCDSVVYQDYIQFSLLRYDHCSSLIISCLISLSCCIFIFCYR